MIYDYFTLYFDILISNKIIYRDKFKT